MSGEGSELPKGEKNFEKKLKKPLTNSPKSDRIKMFREGQKKRRRTLHKPERNSIMRKVTFETIFTALTNFGYDNQEVMDELSKEISKGAEAKAKNAEAYEGIHDLVIGALSDTPATCAEVFEQIETELPSDMGKGKIQYALNHLWQDEIVKIEGKPNTYRRA